MTTQTKYNPHISVDCVVFGFDKQKFKVLLIERTIAEEEKLFNDKKLPGSIILQNEDLDDAASRILNELTGLKNLYLSQFRSFGHPDRTSNPRDIHWLENTMQLKIDRIVTVAYVAMIKIDRKIQFRNETSKANWYELSEVLEMNLAFDHAKIIREGLEHIKFKAETEPYLMFELLPRKFTITQLQLLYDTLYQTKSDVRNFRKKVTQWSYLVALDEFEEGVSHRAARLYKYKR